MAAHLVLKKADNLAGYSVLSTVDSMVEKKVANLVEMKAIIN